MFPGHTQLFVISSTGFSHLSVQQTSKAGQGPGNEAEQDIKYWESWILGGGKRAGDISIGGGD